MSNSKLKTTVQKADIETFRYLLVLEARARHDAWKAAPPEEQPELWARYERAHDTELALIDDLLSAERQGAALVEIASGRVFVRDTFRVRVVGASQNARQVHPEVLDAIIRRTTGAQRSQRMPLLRRLKKVFTR